MADLSVTASRLRFMEGIEARMIPMIADEAIAKGQPVYRKTNGRAAKARANAVGTAKVVGVATSDAAAGEAFEALYHGRMVGYDLTGVNPGSTVYLSAATAGAVDGAVVAGTGNVVAALGTVHTMTDVSSTRFIFFDIPQNVTPVAL
jgi:predicted RecA/RadA family phage recombinase